MLGSYFDNERRHLCIKKNKLVDNNNIKYFLYYGTTTYSYSEFSYSYFQINQTDKMEFIILL